MNYKDYHPDWKDVIRPSILKRDNFACRVCGVVHKSKVYRLSAGGYHICDQFTYEWAITNKKKPFILYLVVAHLDQDKTNNDPVNLLTLCPFHHSKYDAQSKTLLRKMKFNPEALKANFVLPEPIQEHKNHLNEIRSFIKDMTGTRILPTEAEAIFQLTLNFIQNVKN